MKKRNKSTKQNARAERDLITAGALAGEKDEGMLGAGIE
jgi:hypothetical protein